MILTYVVYIPSFLPGHSVKKITCACKTEEVKFERKSMLWFEKQTQGICFIVYIPSVRRIRSYFFTHTEIEILTFS